MKIQKNILYIFSLTMLAHPNLSWAHTGHGDNNALLSGFIHPLTGLDHLFILFAIGIIALRHQSKNKYLMPLLFLVSVGIGFVMPVDISAQPMAEGIIGLSVVTLGITLLLGGNFYTPATLVLLTIFASAHGYAHSVEIDGNPIMVLAGLMTSSALVIQATLFTFKKNALGRSRIRNGIDLLLTSIGAIYLYQA